MLEDREWRADPFRATSNVADGTAALYNHANVAPLNLFCIYVYITLCWVRFLGLAGSGLQSTVSYIESVTKKCMHAFIIGV